MVLVDLVMDLEDYMAMVCMVATYGRDLQMMMKKVHCPCPRDLPAHTMDLDMEDFMALVDLVMDLEDYMAMVFMEDTCGRDLQMIMMNIMKIDPRDPLSLSLVDMDMVAMATTTTTITTHTMDMDTGNPSTSPYTNTLLLVGDLVWNPSRRYVQC